ncbi:TPA: DUF1642 domain-containing protein [Streptococcus suis]
MMDKQYKIGDKVLVRGIVNSEVRNGGIHVLHDGVDAFYTLNQIHEPQKVVVPKFVAEWIEEAKEEGYNLSYAMSDDITPSEVEEWLFKYAYSNEETFARAWLDGYEVEQERLYTVEIPNPHAPIECHSRLAKNYKGKVVLEVQDWLNIAESYKLTEAEIKQDFEWAWQWAEAVEGKND